jgi:hypothetical protein
MDQPGSSSALTIHLKLESVPGKPKSSWHMDCSCGLMITKKIKTAASLLLMAGVLAAGCNASSDNKHAATSTDSTSTTSTTTASVKSVTKESPLKGCYLSVLKKDSLELAITKVTGKSVEGSMILNFAEKDRSRGTFEGEFTDGILIGIYKFNAEGTPSQRQVIFKKVEGGFIEGYGKMTMVNGKEMFAKQNEVEFDQTNVYKYTENCLN